MKQGWEIPEGTLHELHIPMILGETADDLQWGFMEVAAVLRWFWNHVFWSKVDQSSPFRKNETHENLPKNFRKPWFFVGNPHILGTSLDQWGCN